MTFKPKETLTEQVAQHLEDLIVLGQLQSGQRIFENAMSKELEVSHGSIREALLLLEKRFLVTNVPRKGAFVTELNEHFVDSLYETLLLILGHTGVKLVRSWRPHDMERLESLYTQMKTCFEKGDLLNFHKIGVEYTQASLVYADNYFIINMVNDLWPSAKRCSFMALRQGPKIIEDNLSYMRSSLDAIHQRDEHSLQSILASYAESQRQQVIECVRAQTRR
ncbi:GntR family transcriptional regulator [Hahella sp. NBU794]|uniref:GntR family transcriptional regulator n=1 Tax=Hahella sp. NBU794 TaxID=3422590 RepID=UPI003D6F0BCE